MNEKLLVDNVCIEVFSQISASISHELKNALAIINESAGLLDDLLLMAGDDGHIPKEHIQSATSTITKQVARGNTIIKNLNVFAHSRDHEVDQANLDEILTLVAALTDRQAAMKNILVELSCTSEIEIHTYLLAFESVLYLTIISLIDTSPVGARLTISAVKRENDIQIKFSAKNFTQQFMSSGPAEKIDNIVNFLGGSVVCSVNELSILVPPRRR